MLRFPHESYYYCRTTLLNCHEFDSNASLRAVFVTDELTPFRSGLPEAASKSERVDACLAYLLDKRLSDDRPVLPLFLVALRDRYQPGDALRDELAALAGEVQSALVSPAPPPAAQQPHADAEMLIEFTFGEVRFMDWLPGLENLVPRLPMENRAKEALYARGYTKHPSGQPTRQWDHLDRFLQAFDEERAMSGEIVLYNLPKAGDPYDHLMVSIDTQCRQLTIEVTEQTRPERRLALRHRVRERSKKLPGVRPVLPDAVEPTEAEVQPTPASSSSPVPPLHIDPDNPPIAAIRDLLVAAFTPEDLRRFCQDRPAFRPVVARFGTGHGLDDMVDEVIEHCRTQLLWDELLAEVAPVSPRQYARFEPRLRQPPAASPPATPVSRPPDFAAMSNAELRRWLNRQFDDPSLDAFILDYFPEVHSKLSRGMRKDEKLTVLLEHCQRQDAYRQRLLAALAEQT